MGDSRIKDVSSLLSSFFDADKLRQGERYSDFFSSWPAIVGDRLAAHSRVADVNKGILIVEAEHPGWIQLLQLKQSGILANVAKRYPELNLRGIVFRLAGTPAKGGVLGAALDPLGRIAPAAEPDPTPEERAALDEKREEAKKAVEEITDPEFKDLLSSLRKTMLGKD
jgi:hypothetical protein